MSEKQMKDYVGIVPHVATYCRKGRQRARVDARDLFEKALDAEKAGLLQLVQDASGKNTGFIVTEKGKVLLKEEDK